MISNREIIGVLMKRYSIRKKEAEETWQLFKPMRSEGWEIRNIDQLLSYLTQMENEGEIIRKQEEKPMEKKTDVQKLVERYGTIEDSAEKARIRRQLRKAGYYLSKQGKTTPEKTTTLDKILEEDDTEKHPITQQPPKLMEAVGLKPEEIPEKHIAVSFYFNGKLVKRQVVPYQKEIRLNIESN